MDDAHDDCTSCRTGRVYVRWSGQQDSRPGHVSRADCVDMLLMFWRWTATSDWASRERALSDRRLVASAEFGPLLIRRGYI